MDNIISLSSLHFPHTPTVLTNKTNYPVATTTSLSFSAKPPPPPTPPSTPSEPHNSSNIRRPKSVQPTPKKIHTNPLKGLVNTNHVPSPPAINNPLPLAAKLRLSSKLSPPPPPPPPLPPPVQVQDDKIPSVENSSSSSSSSSQETEFRQGGKIFVGNLPNWIKKHQVMEFFRQFGPIKNVILIKGYSDYEKNVGFGFVIYDVPVAEKSALKAVEFDGVEFHGRALTVKLDDGRRLKSKAEDRARWVAGLDEEGFRSNWHKERDRDRKDFRKVLETRPEDWQAVVSAFERIKRKEFGLMVNYYARRGDMHRARQTFESMRARGIEPTSHVYTNLIHAYAVGRDMEEALSCVRKMKEEGIEMSLVTYSIIVGGFAKIVNSEAADYWFKWPKRDMQP